MSKPMSCIGGPGGTNQQKVLCYRGSKDVNTSDLELRTVEVGE